MNYKELKNKAVVLAQLTLIASGLQVVAFAPIAHAELYSMLAPTQYTPQSYIPPQYDAFNFNDFDHAYYRPPTVTQDQTSLSPNAQFSVSTDQQGLQNTDGGTTKTVFTFDANLSTDPQDDPSQLEVRWYFGNHTDPDTYFSLTKTVTHTFAQPGVYPVKLEVLNTSGNISSTTQNITIVQNTPPIPYFTYTPGSGSEATIFHFDTSGSRSDQFLASSLQYRFDWNGDGKWDTLYENTNYFDHVFQDAGTHHVVMEVQDPDGQTAQYSQDITTAADPAPIANFTVKSIPNSNGAGYEFDASSSSDVLNQNYPLLYRWDFNYDGPNDIVYSTDWSSSPTYSGYYSVPGTKTIELEVKNADGAVSSAYAQITVGWTDVFGKDILNGLR